MEKLFGEAVLSFKARLSARDLKKLLLTNFPYGNADLIKIPALYTPYVW
jgi:hypothetical protein